MEKDPKNLRLQKKYSNAILKNTNIGLSVLYMLFYIKLNGYSISWFWRT